MQGSTVMERPQGVLPAWEDCAMSLPEVALPSRRHQPQARQFYGSGEAQCVSPRQLPAIWTGGMAGSSMLMSLREVVSALDFDPQVAGVHSPMASPTPSSAISSPRRSSLPGLESPDMGDSPRSSKNSAANKKHRASVYGKEDGKRCLQAATFKRIVQWVISKEVRPCESARASATQAVGQDGAEECKSPKGLLSPRYVGLEVEVSGSCRAFLAAYRQHASASRLLSVVDTYYRKHSPQEKKNCVHFVAAWVEEGFTRDFYRCVRKSHQPPANSRALKQLLALLALMTESHPTEVNRVKLAMLRKAREAPQQGVLSEKKRKGSGHSGRLDVLTWDIAELAEQMTLVESTMFLAVRPAEFHKLAWRKDDSRRKASPNIVAVVERFNTVSYWVSSSIVMCSDIRKRVTMLKRFVQLAEECLRLRNFSTLMAVLAGLNNSAVRRLKLTWAGLKETTKKSLAALGEVMETKSNYKRYRDILLREESATAPVVPYLGLYLRDLTFIDEGNADRKDERINFEKLVMQGEVILQVARWQRNGTYDFKTTGEGLSLSKMLVLPEEILYKKSEAIEPASLHTQL